MSRTKCVVIREELVALTGDFKKAIVLGQLLYWSERVRDRALFIEEEHQRFEHAQLSQSTTYGWFYKRAEDLSEETMMGVKPKAMREYIKHLVEQGWVFEQRPTDRLDRTLFYRVNLVKIHQDLIKLGYNLKRCTTHSFLPMDEKEASIGGNESATGEEAAATIMKPPSNRRKKNLATSAEENTPSSTPLATQGLQATNIPPEIKEQRLLDSEITHTDYLDAVCMRITELFGKKLSKAKVQTLIDLAAREDVDLEQAIENTYKYHTTVEKFRSLFGAIKHAIENRGWEMQSASHSKRVSKPLPKAVQQQRDKTWEKEQLDPKLWEQKLKSYRAKMERAGYIYDEATGQWDAPAKWYIGE